MHSAIRVADRFVMGTKAAIEIGPVCIHPQQIDGAIGAGDVEVERHGKAETHGSKS